MSRWCSGALAERAGVVIDLDRYYGRITFLEGLREALPVFLHHRPATAPRPWEPAELAGFDAPCAYSAGEAPA